MTRWQDLLLHREHRPYPPPEARFDLTMSWHDLLFAHWPVPAATLRALVPASLDLDLWHGQGWIGVVPFHMTSVGPPALNWLPSTSAFAELNLRTYVTRGGKPGVHFFSLDAASWPAVIAARLGFRLPYFWARIQHTPDGSGLRYESRRRIGPAARLAVRYRPCSEIEPAPAASLEQWLTQRYCLYTTDGAGRAYRGEIHHMPWPLQRAEAEFSINEMTRWLGIELPDEPPLLHFARRLDVLAWSLRRVDR